MAKSRGYIELGGKRYATHNRSLVPRKRKAQQINVTVGGTTTSQTFGFTSDRWQLEIITQLNPASVDYGSWEDLETAYEEQPYVIFVDNFGVEQGEVFFEGELAPNFNMALAVDNAEFVVPITLRKRQV